MARRAGGSNKGVEAKRQMLPIYQHYTLSPGKTKSHHPEAKCNHCLKEFVCGSKQRLIRHLRKCNSISNPEQIIAETLNTLARNSATGQLNHSILEASNLLPSQISQIQHSTTQQLVGQAIHHHSGASCSSTTAISTTANSNVNKITSLNNGSTNDSCHNVSGSSLTNDSGVIASPSNGSVSLSDAIPAKKPLKRGRKPGSLGSKGPGIHVTTGIDGKTHFTPASQLPQAMQVISSMQPIHSNRVVNYAYHQQATVTPGSQPTSMNSPVTHLSTSNSAHLNFATPNHQTPPFKLSSEPIDKAYLKLVLTRNLPLSLCDTKEFHLWVKTFAIDYKPPNSINLIAQNLKSEAQAARQRVSNILVKASKKTINLELQNWIDELRGHHWFVIIAGLDYKRFIISVKDLIDHTNSNANLLNDVGQSLSDKALTEFIDDCIKRVGSDRVNSLMLARKNNDDAFVKKARQCLYTTHPSIVTHHCWWHFTNVLCSDIIEHNEAFFNVLRHSNLLVNFVNKRPQIFSSLEKFGPFAGISSSLSPKKDDKQWYTHLVCYLLEYVKNNNEAIIRALENYTQPTTQFTSDSNNNSSDLANHTRATSQHNSLPSTQQQTSLYQLLEIKSIAMSSQFWTDLNSALVYLKPIKEILALTSTVSYTQTIDSTDAPSLQHTPTILPNVVCNLSLSEYFQWYLNYGKQLIESWRQSADTYKYQLISYYLNRFSSFIQDFRLLFAAYLLNPKHKCAFMTMKAKDVAIEEILNIASEFMPEESDGHTIFDQWKLYLVREEPYDVVYDEQRTSALDWWLSLPCAESIRRVALRILRLKAFTSPKAEALFSQLYFYEDETNANIDRSTFEDVAVLRYFYDHEDKIGQQINHGGSHHNSVSSINQNSASSINGYHDRAQIGEIHNNHLHSLNSTTKFLPLGPISISESGDQFSETLAGNENKSTFDSFSDVVVDSYMNHSEIDQQSALTNSTISIENLPAYEQFSMYVDFNEVGVHVVEEPVEKKKRKWTAQEILSKCQPNPHHSNNNSNDITSK